MSEYMYPRKKPPLTVEELDNRGTLLEGLYDLPEPVVQTEVEGSELDASDLDSANRAARMMQIKHQLGFYPQGKRELAQTFALGSDTYSHNRGGAAKFLNEVLRHQIKHAPNHVDDEPPYDPEAALRSIVSEWGANIDSSRGAITALKFLREDIRASGEENRFAGLGNLSRVRDWRHQDWTHRAIAVMTRNHDADAFVYDADEDTLDVKYESSDPAIMQREADYLKSVRLGGTGKLLDGLIAAHADRLSFWLERVDEARAHNSVRAQATRIVEKYRKS